MIFMVGWFAGGTGSHRRWAPRQEGSARSASERLRALESARSAWERLGAHGTERLEALGSAWERLGTPGSAWESLGAPGSQPASQPASRLAP